MQKKKKKKPNNKKADSDYEIIGYYIADGRTQVLRRNKKNGKESKSYRM